MILIQDLRKTYGEKSGHPFLALKGINLVLPDKGFVSILGPSGCGKTTLLNLVGGLDSVKEGDILVDGKSLKSFSPKECDAYRNSYVGMVFQSYHLIPHLNVFENVGLSLDLKGVGNEEKKKKVEEVLKKVGLSDKGKSYPSELSGGQCQRAAIARAVVGDPKVLLADEPTGALDSENSLAVMELLKDLSKERLVLMVTHNEELAGNYSSRIVTLQDGRVISDTGNPKEIPEDRKETKELSPSHLPFPTAVKMGWKSLFSSKGKSSLTVLASSLGIVGLALVFGLTSGFSHFIAGLEENTLTEFPLSVENYTLDVTNTNSEGYEAYSDNGVIRIQKNNTLVHVNNITKTFADTLQDDVKDYADSVQISYALRTNILTEDLNEGKGNVKSLTTDTSSFVQSFLSTSYYFHTLPSDSSYVLDKYDVLQGTYPAKENEFVLVVNPYDSLPLNTLNALGFKFSTDENGNSIVKFDDVIGKEFKVVPNDGYYIPSSEETPIENARFLKEEKNGDPDAMNRMMGELSNALSDLTTSSLSAKAFKNVLATVGEYFSDTEETRLVHSYTLPDQSALNAVYQDGSVGKMCKITGILRAKSDVLVPSLSTGLYVLPSLIDEQRKENSNSQIARDYKNCIYIRDNSKLDLSDDSEMYSMNGEKFNLAAFIPKVRSVIGESKELSATSPNDSIASYLSKKSDQISNYSSNRKVYGSDDSIYSLLIYPKTFQDKSAITSYIDRYNSHKKEADMIYYTDLSGTVFSSLETLVRVLSVILIAFSSISLVSSSLMMGVLTYNSVLSRKKEIGILRAVGARKKDVGILFEIEALLVGFFSGLLGDFLGFVLCYPLSEIINARNFGVDLSSIARLRPLDALFLLLIAVVLNFVAALIPSLIASKKDPIEAIRDE